MIHGILCCVCLVGGDEGWGCLPCGHVLHMDCILRLFNVDHLEHDSRRVKKCPLCQRQIRLKNVTRLFLSESNETNLELDDECKSDLDADGQVLNLKVKVSELENRLKNMKEDLENERKQSKAFEERANSLSGELSKLQQESWDKLKNIRTERDAILHDAKKLENKVANLKVELERERGYAARQLVALDLSLTGEQLIRKLKNIDDSKEWFYEILDSRNKKIGSLMNKIEKLEKEKSLLEVSSLKAAKESSVSHPRGPGHVHPRREKLVGRENTPPESHQIEMPHASIWDADVVGLAKPQVEKRRRIEPQGNPHDDDIVILDDSDDDSKHQEIPMQARQSAKLLSRAGPSKMAMKAAPGPSFIHKTNLATTGLEDSSTFIKRVPDGKGGWKQVYRNQPLQQGGFKRTKATSSGKTIPTFFRK